MARHSSSECDGVASFEHDPRAQTEFPLGTPIDDLGKALREQYAGRRLTVRQVFEHHSPSEPTYIMRNYQEALRRLEAAGQVQMNPPAEKRKKRKNVVSLAPHVEVIFLPRRQAVR